MLGKRRLKEIMKKRILSFFLIAAISVMSVATVPTSGFAGTIKDPIFGDQFDCSGTDKKTSVNWTALVSTIAGAVLLGPIAPVIGFWGGAIAAARTIKSGTVQVFSGEIFKDQSNGTTVKCRKVIQTKRVMMFTTRWVDAYEDVKNTPCRPGDFGRTNDGTPNASEKWKPNNNPYQRCWFLQCKEKYRYYSGIIGQEDNIDYACQQCEQPVVEVVMSDPTEVSYVKIMRVVGSGNDCPENSKPVGEEVCFSHRSDYVPAHNDESGKPIAEVRGRCVKKECQCNQGYQAIEFKQGDDYLAKCEPATGGGGEISR